MDPACLMVPSFCTNKIAGLKLILAWEQRNRKPNLERVEKF